MLSNARDLRAESMTNTLHVERVRPESEPNQAKITLPGGTVPLHMPRLVEKRLRRLAKGRPSIVFD